MNDLEHEIDALKKALKEETAQHACWLFNAKALQVGYNDLDAKLRACRAELAVKQQRIAALDRIIAEKQGQGSTLDGEGNPDLDIIADKDS